MEEKKMEEERKKVLESLDERLKTHDETNRKTAQKKLSNSCDGLKAQIDSIESENGRELNEKFTAEQNRLQTAFNELQADNGDDPNETSKKIQRAKGELLVIQSYDIIVDKKIKLNLGDKAFDLSSLCKLRTERQLAPEMTKLMKPTNVRVSKLSKDTFILRFTCLGPDEMRVLSRKGVINQIWYTCLVTKRGEKKGSEVALKRIDDDRFESQPMKFEENSSYEIRVNMEFGFIRSEWSDEIIISGGAEIEESESDVREWNLEKLKERESIIEMLIERLAIHDESRKAAYEKLHNFFERLKTQVPKLYENINGELGEKFIAKDNRLQAILSELRSSKGEDISKMIQKAKTELLTEQTYNVVPKNPDEAKDEEEEPEMKRMRTEGEEDKEGVDLTSLFELKTEKKVASLGSIDFEERKPTKVVPSFTEEGKFSLSFTFFYEDEEEVLKGVYLPFEVEVKIWEKDQDEEGTSKTLKKRFIFESDEPVFFRNTFPPNAIYCLKMRILHQEVSTQWSDVAKFTTLEFRNVCVWKECPDDVYKNREYSFFKKNPRIATKGGYFDYCTTIGNTHIPLNKVISWNIKILKSEYNIGEGIYIGIASSGINQNEKENFKKCGWYFDCYYSTLWSGPPHNYRGKEYGPRKGRGNYVHTGDSVGVVMDTEKGTLSFIVDGVNHGVAYEGIPLDKPLVPCVILLKDGDSVEFDTSEVKENVDSFIPVPSDITTKSPTWDSITLTWDVVGSVSFYQIELDGSKSYEMSTTNTFTKRDLLPDTEYTFRVRAVRENSVSERSVVVKGRTLKESFETSSWKKCPDNVDENRKYSVSGENLRTALKDDYVDYCTIVGNTPIPLNQVTSWSIKILKSESNNGEGIYIGVAPFDINQNKGDNYNKCGWYFNCYTSTLCPEPQNKCRDKKYGPRKRNGQYVHTGDSVGVVMDTANCNLSFVLDGVNHGVAFEGIPLDKPLVPCVLLNYKGDSVELVIYKQGQ